MSGKNTHIVGDQTFSATEVDSKPRLLPRNKMSCFKIFDDGKTGTLRLNHKQWLEIRSKIFGIWASIHLVAK